MKVKAFTLSEMIVVLLITTIVVGLAFAVLNLVQKQMWGIEQNYENKTELNLLRQALWIDFETYPNIVYNENTNVLHFENEIKSMDYYFDGELIIRQKDTFNIKLDGKAFYFDGLQTLSGQIDAIELLTTKDLGAKTIFIYNDNGANEYIY